MFITTFGTNMSCVKWISLQATIAPLANGYNTLSMRQGSKGSHKGEPCGAATGASNSNSEHTWVVSMSLYGLWLIASKMSNSPHPPFPPIPLQLQPYCAVRRICSKRSSAQSTVCLGESGRVNKWVDARLADEKVTAMKCFSAGRNDNKFLERPKFPDLRPASESPKSTIIFLHDRFVLCEACLVACLSLSAYDSSGCA